jgi:autotransporter-associated beta strand protein
MLNNAILRARRSPRRAAFVLALAAAVASGGNAFADTSYWSAGAGEWTTAGNWSTGAYPDAPDAVAMFPSILVPTGAITVATGVTVGGLVVDGASAYTFQAGGSASSLTFASTLGPAALTVTPTAGSTTFNVPLVLASDLAITHNSATALLLSAPLSGSGAVTLSSRNEIRLTAASPGWTPSLITLNSGTLTAAGGVTALGNPATGTVSIHAGATLDMSAVAGSSGSFAKTLLLAGAGATAPTLLFSATDTTLSGPMSLAGAVALAGKQATAVLTLAGPLTGTGSLIKAGAGTVRLATPAGFTGGTVVDSGTLVVLPGGSLAGTGGVTINAGAKLVLSAPAGNDPASAGVSPNAVVLNGGTLGLAADVAVANLLSSASTSGVLSVESGNAFTSGGSNVIDLSSLGPASVVRLAGAGNTSIAPSVAFIPNAYTHTLQFGGGTAGTFTVAGAIGDVNGAATLVEIGGGGQAIALTGANTYTGATLVNSGATLLVSSASALGSALAGTTIAPGALVTVSAASAEPF